VSDEHERPPGGDPEEGGDAVSPDEDDPDAAASGREADAVLAVDGDDLAGIVDLFGALERERLLRALDELAFKRDVAAPDERIVGDAVASYHLVEHDGRLVAGPAAFPTLPEGAADLPHIMDAEARDPDPAAVGRTVEERFRSEAARALADVDADEREESERDRDRERGGDAGADATDERIRRLLDVSYDVEAWGPVDLSDVRRRLDDAAGTDR
jgi:hypothetical protein